MKIEYVTKVLDAETIARLLSNSNNLESYSVERYVLNNKNGISVEFGTINSAIKFMKQIEKLEALASSEL